MLTNVKLIMFLTIILLDLSSAFADGGKESRPLQTSETKLTQLFESSETKANADAANRYPLPPATLGSTPPPTPLPSPSPENTDDVIGRLLKQVQSLKTKIVVSERTEQATQRAKSAKNIGSRTVYNFKDGDVYEIRCGVDSITDIELQIGEQLTNAPVAGDTVRWKIGVIRTGEGKKETTHIIIKPLDTNIETNFLITTNLRAYHLRATASDWYMPAIAWNYPQDEIPDLSQIFVKREREEVLSLEPENLSFNYKVKGDDYSWKPLRVFDDGEHSYFQMPKSLKTSEAPALFVLDDDDPILVNYRVKGDYYIVDRLIDEVELRIGTKKRVRVCREDHCRSFLGGLF